MEDHWLAQAKKLHAIASTGLHFGASDFDKERYQEIADIANAMLADLANVPIQAIADLFPNTGRAYATPQLDVRGVVIRNNTILLVRERTDGLWTLPGGYADVGLSAAENTVKEVLEEANLQVNAQRLIAVKHKAKHAYQNDMRDFYKLFFLCTETQMALDPRPGLETSAAAFFQRHQLPPLSTSRVVEADIAHAFAAAANTALPTLFD